MKPNNTESNLKNEVFQTIYKKIKTVLNKDSNCWKSAKTRLGRRTSLRTVMDSAYHTYAISSAALFITLDGKYDGPS